MGHKSVAQKLVDLQRFANSVNAETDRMEQLARLEKIGTAMLDAVIDMNVTREEFELVWTWMRECFDSMPGGAINGT